MRYPLLLLAESKHLGLESLPRPFDSDGDAEASSIDVCDVGETQEYRDENVSSPRSVCQLIRFDPSVFDSRFDFPHCVTRGCQ